MSKTVQPVSKEFYLLTGISSALFIAGQTIEPILPLFITELGASTFELGLIISMFSITAMISKIPLGILVEKAGKWLIIPISLIGQAICFFLYSVVPDPTWFYPIRIFHALILTAFLPAVIAIISDLSPPGKRGDRMGRFLTSFGVAMMFGPFLCSILLNYVGFRLLFQLTATIPLLTCVIFFLAKYRGSYTFSVREERSYEERKPRSLRSLATFARSRNMLVLCYLRLTFAFTNAFFITFFAVHVSENLLFSSSLIAILFGVRGVTNTLFRFPAGQLSDRIGYKMPLVSAFLLLSSIFLVISETGTVYTLAFAMGVYGIAHGIRAVAEWTLLADSAPPDLRATSSAYLATMFNVGESFGAVVAGALSLVLPIPMIFKIATFILLPAAVSPIFIKQDFRHY